VAGQRDALGHWTAASYDALGQRAAVIRDCTTASGTPAIWRDRQAEDGIGAERRTHPAP